jgi:hypothetical protein
MLDDDSANWSVHDNVTANVDVGLKLNSTSLNEQVHDNQLGATQAAIQTNGTYDWTGSDLYDNVYCNPNVALGANVTQWGNSFVTGSPALPASATSVYTIPPSLVPPLPAAPVVVAAPVVSATLYPPTEAPAPAVQNVYDPKIAAAGGVELGLKFTSDTAGFITGVRFFKGSLNTGIHTGSLWTANGQLLASATFINETDSGWQQVTFSNPVAITANATYVVSYHTSSASIAYTAGMLASQGIDSGPLHAPSSSTAGGNSVYVYGATGFPSVYNGKAPSYWVDAVFTTQPAAVQTAASIFSSAYAPAAAQQNVNDASIAKAGGVELGMKFTSDTDGFITGIRFWKGSQNAGTHTGSLWSSTGQLLATATFTNETASGWQQVTFSTPVAVKAGATYIVSYHTTSSHITYVRGILAAAITNQQLHVPADTASDGSTFYQYGPGGFPTRSNGQSAWYGVDVVFSATS